MSLRSILITAGLVLGLFIVASPAEAAKGVKKKQNLNQKGGEHHHHGKVVEVNHKLGHMIIAAHHQTKKKKANLNKNAAAGSIKYTISANTKFAHKHGKQTQPATFAALRVGEHVSVTGHQHHAEAVMIHGHVGKGMKKGMKKGPKKGLNKKKPKVN